MAFHPNIRAFLVITLLTTIQTVKAQSDVADVPPMGWNSYDCYSYAVNESEVRDNARFMAKNLKKSGWKYIVVDYIWSCPRLNPDFAPNQNDSMSPKLNMDSYGRLLPDVARFPSSANGLGFRPLADSFHKHGLKFGIHLMRGIPRQAVAAKSPIADTNFTADQAFTPKNPCGWLNHMWGLDMSKPAAQAYLDSIFRLYAEWNVDFVKVDDLSNPYSDAEIEGYRKAIAKCGRQMVLSLSPGPTPLDAGPHVSQNANMWRLLGDLWDTWPQLDEAFKPLAAWTPYRGPNHWPDPDMLPLGRLRKFGPNTGPANTDSRFTKDEARTLMTLWCISKSPLMFGGNLPETDPYTLSLITNGEVLDVNQHSTGNHALIQGTKPIWIADQSDPHIQFVAMFNRTSESTTSTLLLSDLGIKTAKVRDLWTHKDLPIASGNLTVQLAPHASVLYKLYVTEAAEMTESAPQSLDLKGTSYEAESSDNTLSGQARVVDDAKDGKCSGGKLVRFIGSNPQSRLKFNKIMADHDGDFVLSIVYMSGSARKMNLSVNDTPPISLDFPSTGGWDGNFLDIKVVTVHLKSGQNTLEFGNPTDWGVDLDRIVVSAK